jgi:hypothetical protein
MLFLIDTVSDALLTDATGLGQPASSTTSDAATQTANSERLLVFIIPPHCSGDGATFKIGPAPALSSNFYNHPRDGSEKDPTIHVLLLLSF